MSFETLLSVWLADQSPFQNERMRNRHCSRDLGSRRKSKMATKPNCLIVCSSATQGMGV